MAFVKFGTKNTNDSDSSKLLTEVILEDGKITKESKLKKVVQSTDVEELKKENKN